VVQDLVFPPAGHADLRESADVPRPHPPSRCAARVSRILFRLRGILSGTASVVQKSDMDKQLEAVAESQSKWSATADALEKTYERTRMIVFVLSTLGALLAAISSQQDGQPRTTLAIVSAVCFAVVSFLTARLLGSRHAQALVRARAASEAMKREAYKYAAQAAPYDDQAARGARLRTEVQKIEADVDDLISEQAPEGPSSLPRDIITPQEYIDRVSRGRPRRTTSHGRASTRPWPGSCAGSSSPWPSRRLLSQPSPASPVESLCPPAVRESGVRRDRAKSVRTRSTRLRPGAAAPLHRPCARTMSPTLAT
jgi:hypothetical protein